MRSIYCLAVLFLLSGCNGAPEPAPVDVNALIALNDKTFDLVLQSAEAPASAAAEAAEHDFLYAFEAARPLINAAADQINHLPRAEGGLQPYEISACIDMNAGNMQVVDSVIRKAHEKGMTELLAQWLSSSSDCTFRSSAFLTHVAHDEDLGYAMSITYPLTMAIHARAATGGLQIPTGYHVALIESYQRETDKIIREADARLTSHQVAMNLQPKLQALKQKLSVIAARENTSTSGSEEAQPAR